MTDVTQTLSLEKQPQARSTNIPGLLILDIAVNTDNRGWFIENWHLAHFSELGLGSFRPVQHNTSFNTRRGVTRGFHAEPWDKLVSVSSGSAFGAWIDLRAGATFGHVVQQIISPGTAIYVPRGVANSYQALEDATAYSYLVNDHWSSKGNYVAVNLADPDLAVAWPINISHAIVSEKDRSNPNLSEISPLLAGQPLVIGSSGQLARALSAVYPNATFLSSEQFDMGKANLGETIAKMGISTQTISCVINAAAFTNVDLAETEHGRSKSWAINVLGVKELVSFCQEQNLTLVHVSTDFVFNGKKDKPYLETDESNPVNFYGFTKATADFLVKQLPKHFVVRPSWVIGDADNFVRVMSRLALEGGNPKVVDDQFGRFTFADELAKSIRHLIDNDCPPGTYNVSGAGASYSRADWARKIFAFYGRNESDVEAVSSSDFSRDRPSASRPKNSELSLEKILGTGISIQAAEDSLVDYLSNLNNFQDSESSRP